MFWPARRLPGIEWSNGFQHSASLYFSFRMEEWAEFNGFSAAWSNLPIRSSKTGFFATIKRVGCSIVERLERISYPSSAIYGN